MADIFGALNDALGFTEDPAANQRKADEAAMAWQKYVYNTTREDLAPYLESGKNFLGVFDKAMGEGGMLDPNARFKDFKFSQDDPGYKWRVKQGVDALNASGSAGGMLGSGNLGTALVNYGQEAGSQEYQNSYNRYVSDLNNWMGQRAASYNMLVGASNPNAPVQMGNFSMQSGVQVGNTLMSGSALQQSALNARNSNLQGTIGAAGNIGKSIYDIYQRNQMDNYYADNNPYQSQYWSPSYSGSTDYGLSSGGGYENYYSSSQGYDLSSFQ